MTAEDLARLRGPIGLDLGGRSPGETALAIMAEIVAVRHNTNGGPMRDRARAIEAAAKSGDADAPYKREPAASAA